MRIILVSVVKEPVMQILPISLLFHSMHQETRNVAVNCVAMEEYAMLVLVMVHVMTAIVNVLKIILTMDQVNALRHVL
jgi:hypothetical protein